MSRLDGCETKSRLIAYSLRNISAQRCQNWQMHTEVIESQTSVVFETLHIIIIIIKGIYIAQVRKGHKCAMSAVMAVWLRNCLYLYSYLSHN